ncbi:YbaB/EbfC family nucleoid-associated protein [Micromonospora sp. NPDC047548]|uniref:YbaB/EbfC family nucleoid-associated protein n=1 Tax=Micromonospora sp. NPDC047548 TaxID=3155624 RepID=UPI0033FE867A
MSGGQGDFVEDLFEYYQRQRAGLSDLQRRMQAISATASSARREVEVTVGHTGVVTNITFPTSAYRRMAPQELSAMLIRVITDAKDLASAQAVDILRPLMPPGLDASELVSGKLSVEKLIPATPNLPRVVDERLSLPDA